MFTFLMCQKGGSFWVFLVNFPVTLFICTNWKLATILLKKAELPYLFKWLKVRTVLFFPTWTTFLHDNWDWFLCALSQTLRAQQHQAKFICKSYNLCFHQSPTERLCLEGSCSQKLSLLVLLWRKNKHRDICHHVLEDIQLEMKFAFQAI